MHEKQFNYLANYMTKLSSTVISNKESLQKIESDLDTKSYNISKFDYQLNKVERIYVDQRKNINQYITKVERHVPNNNVINSQFEEKLNKAILNTKQVTINLSDACDKATSSNF
eukprot:15366627-Ditylum_brightwellii.AAC.1